MWEETTLNLQLLLRKYILSYLNGSVKISFLCSAAVKKANQMVEVIGEEMQNKTESIV